MVRTRAIPCLLLKGHGLVKTVKFKNPKYLGDPINIIRIFNDKGADELVLLDVDATAEKRRPPFDMLERIASECFMPLCFGGGVRSIEDMKRLFGIGIEKVAVNSYAAEHPDFITAAASVFGSQSIVVSMDVGRTFLGTYRCFTHGGSRATKLDPARFAREMADRGAGEILLNSIERDGTMQGYDIAMIQKIASSVSVPVVACGGAGTVDDLGKAVIEGGASAAGAGSMFVFQGPHRAVLVSYPSEATLHNVFRERAERVEAFAGV